MTKRTFDIAIIGGGIVGLATALALSEQEKFSLVVIEKEDRLAAHQTGNNSGVIHSGLYYKPGSLKAQNCTEGREALYRFCEEHNIAHERCGKIVVATRQSELPALDMLAERGAANGLDGIQRLSAEQIKDYEPHSAGIAGLFVPQTGIVDYAKVTEKYAELVESRGGLIRPGLRMTGFQATSSELVIETTSGPVPCRNLVNCAGLQSDRVASMCGVNPGLLITPFRGEYYEIIPTRQHLVKNLIYPVPDTRFPFLGVHFTRMIQGGVEAGPNAVPALQREGYSWGDISVRDTFELLTYIGFWRMGLKFWRMGLGEIYRSFSKGAFVNALQRLIPELQPADVHRAGSGVRAQALEPDGALVDDFRIVEADRMIHVLNAPSPAATASLSIGKSIADMAIKRFELSNH